MGLGGDRINLALSSDCLITDPVGKNPDRDGSGNRKLSCFREETGWTGEGWREWGEFPHGSPSKNPGPIFNTGFFSANELSR